MTTILVNAVSSKTGGARTIVEGFAASAAKFPQHEFHVFAGFPKPEGLPAHVHWACLPKSGAGAAFFTLFGSLVPFVRLKCRHLISFNNMNALLVPSRCKTTYFHQAKALDPSSRERKSRVYRAYLRTARDRFLVQTPLVADRLRALLARGRHDIEIVWPGMAPLAAANDAKGTLLQTVLVPVSDIGAPHKNFEFVVAVANLLPAQAEILVTAPPDAYAGNPPGNIRFIGPVSREGLFDLYRRVNCVLFPSRIETVGLPIFEALSVSTPVVAFAADYISALYGWFGFTSGLELARTPAEASEMILSMHENRPEIRSKTDFRPDGWHGILEHM